MSLNRTAVVLSLSLFAAFLAPLSAQAQEPTASQTVESSAAEPSGLIVPRETGTLQDPQAEAEKILSQPEFRDTGQIRSRNWFSNATENLFKALAEFLKRLFGNRQLNAPNVPFIGGVPTALVWGIIALAIIAFLAWAISKFGWGASAKKRKKRIGGLMDEDEPDRTADEWLVRADELAAEGKHREAVRCLYLACLVRLDEARIARLIRAETNWEHLARIEASTKKPENLDFRTPTQKFDQIWYGFRTQGQPDVDDFKAVYTDLCNLINQPKAA